MSDCCLPNLGCLSIPIISTQVNGPPGPNGTNGVGITTAFYNPVDGTLLLNYSDGSSQNVGVVQGNIGNPGPDGVPGLARLYVNTTEQSSAILNTFVPTSYQYIIPANALIDNGDSLVINLRAEKFTNAGDQFTGCQRRILFNATSCTIFGFVEVAMYAWSETLQYNTRVEIIKTSATTARCLVVSDVDLYTNTVQQDKFTYENTLTGLNFTTTNTISAELFQAIAGQVRLNSITIDKIKALIP
jgi:hypothetical protein